MDESTQQNRGMDWAVKEVRDYKLALLDESADKYELAGIELDFLRDDTRFRDDGPSEDERTELITDFVGSVRLALDRKEAGHRWLCVRIPLQLTAHPRSGLDMGRLREAGVDMFNLSGWYPTTQTTDVSAARTLAPDAAIYVEMTHSTGWHPHFLQPGIYGTDGDPRTSDHQFYTTSLLSHERGADGVSLFNFVYYRMGHQSDVPVMEPPFHVLPKLNDVAFLTRQHRYYMLGQRVYHSQLPRRIEDGRSEAFEMDMLAAGPGTEESPGRLRLHFREACPDNLRLIVYTMVVCK